jgi:hypothetical protein
MRRDRRRESSDPLLFPSDAGPCYNRARARDRQCCSSQLPSRFFLSSSPDGGRPRTSLRSRLIGLMASCWPAVDGPAWGSRCYVWGLLSGDCQHVWGLLSPIKPKQGEDSWQKTRILSRSDGERWPRGKRLKKRGHAVGGKKRRPTRSPRRTASSPQPRRGRSAGG